MYRIYSNERRGAYLIFRAPSAALIWGRRLFKNCTRQIYFFYIFIQRYTFYLLIFLRTDTKLIVNLELREKFTRWKKPREFHDNESEIISGESELLCRCGAIYNVQSILMSLSPHRGCGACWRAALINSFVPDAALIRGRRLFEYIRYAWPVVTKTVISTKEWANWKEMKVTSGGSGGREEK